MKIGILGFGYMGKIHAHNALSLGHEIYVYDPNDSVGRTVDTARECIQRAEAIIISSPIADHYSAGIRCHGQGGSHTARPFLVEKPIGRSMTESEHMVSGAIDKGVVVMVGNNMRYHPVVKVVKERMHELGGNYNGAWFRLHQEKQNAKDPVILNWGAHEVDLALYLLDKKLTVMQGHSKVEHDLAEFIIRYSSGPLVHMDLSYHGPNERCFTIHGPNASIHADLDNFVVHIFSRQGREIIAVEGSHEQTYVDEMKEFIRRVEGHAPDGIGATGEDGLRCLKVLLERG